MEKGSVVTVKVTFKDANGGVTIPPQGVSFTSVTPGVSTLTFNPTANEDGSYDLTVAGEGLGTDSIGVPALSGTLQIEVTATVATTVEFSPTSV